MTLAGFMPRPLLALVVLSVMAALGPAHAQKKGEPDFEEFAAVCPYTNGDQELERKLGYTRVGHFPWRGADDTEAVRVNMGAVPMVFVETENFRIGSSLTTYRLPNDREERARLNQELARLEAKLGRLKAPRRELDPWLRLHLFAQRAEDLYRQFHADWGIQRADYERHGPHLGFKHKFLLLLCERKSEYARYLLTYEKSALEYVYRTGWFGEGMLVVGNIEAIAEHWQEEKDVPLDSMFACMILASVAGNLIDGWNSNLFRAPTWLTYGYMHLAQRRFDPRWPVFDGRKIIYGKEEDKTDWEPRVGNLVRNSFFADAEQMFGWAKYEDLNQRDHMVAWSKLSYLLTAVEGERKTFLDALCPPLTSATRDDPEERKAGQREALERSFGLTPEQLDEGWAQWVRRTYKRR